jgi:hypothetical protein
MPAIIGKPAPAFKAQSIVNGEIKEVSLDDFKGAWVWVGCGAAAAGRFHLVAVICCHALRLGAAGRLHHRVPLIFSCRSAMNATAASWPRAVVAQLQRSAP